eukprot:GHUV01015922.1.p2 GENE.GHUV01015922.1~~GHUV01015922.1.p2  ORF type:complete len:109 (-),score=16.56 GHUV01015922.1:776-1102(-)
MPRILLSHGLCTVYMRYARTLSLASCCRWQAVGQQPDHNSVEYIVNVMTTPCLSVHANTRHEQHVLQQLAMPWQLDGYSCVVPATVCRSPWQLTVAHNQLHPAAGSCT